MTSDPVGSVQLRGSTLSFLMLESTLVLTHRSAFVRAARIARGQIGLTWRCDDVTIDADY